ncbi:hypothetical protein ACGF0J_16565 [Nonomuraea sp. NPDC047897]
MTTPRGRSRVRREGLGGLGTSEREIGVGASRAATLVREVQRIVAG